MAVISKNKAIKSQKKQEKLYTQHLIFFVEKWTIPKPGIIIILWKPRPRTAVKRNKIKRAIREKLRKQGIDKRTINAKIVVIVKYNKDISGREFIKSVYSDIDIFLSKFAPIYL